MNNGDIPLLDADRLDDYEGEATRSTSRIETQDDYAIRAITTKLRKTERGSKLEDERLDDMAIDLYNKMSDMIRRGLASKEQITKYAELCGESAEQLVSRITDADSVQS